ncbi:hypothetical protein ABH13_1355 [Bacillus velezensis]|nr:hypothetical protein U471_13670 [Bacillus amyloliquefaciens CC178]AKL75945.1 hypothetical protein ABH13_1355 [Bacillus velezensis]KYC88291.1 hypothetical protein B4140_1468 [Bacillus amyloliquefaciens]QEY88331.1 hypothetical protein BACIT_0356 [Bacillus amyloliquefaciens]QEY93092.1 hypothetical protein BACIH_1339 [Bacillus amyloliquefaciens]
MSFLFYPSYIQSSFYKRNRYRETLINKMKNVNKNVSKISLLFVRP